MTSSPRGKTKPEIQGFPPKWLSKVPEADLARSRGDEVADFAEALCKITKDSIAGHAGEPLRFRGWQRELTRQLFAVKADNTFRHKIALIGLPRKNGKSAWLSAVALENLIFGATGGEIYSCAAEKEQAKIVFNTAKEMIRLEPELSDLLEVYKDTIYNPKTGSVYRALSAEAFTKEGLNPTFVAFDELHAQPNRELWDVMSLAMGARVEPMMVAITTAGVKTDTSGKDSLCFGLYEYGKRVALGEIDDPTFFGVGQRARKLRGERRGIVAQRFDGQLSAVDPHAEFTPRAALADKPMKRLCVEEFVRDEHAAGWKIRRRSESERAQLGKLRSDGGVMRLTRLGADFDERIRLQVADE